MDTIRSLVLLSVFLLVPLVLGGDSVETDPEANAPTCKMIYEKTIMKNGRLVRCANCENVAANEDHSTDEVCRCPDGSRCDATQKEGMSTVFEYYCTKRFVDESRLRSGLHLDQGEGQVTESG